jgi:hypothetical protein
VLSTAKHKYWRASRALGSWRDALSGSDRAFRAVVLGSYLRPAAAIAPVSGETAGRARAALNWLVRAQDATPDDGASYGYFPVSRARGWDVSYPETTGYIMTSLVNFARKTGHVDLIDRAHRMALWEADIQMASGAVQGGRLTTPDRRSPAAFNTGMVLDGLVTVLEERADTVVQRAAERAARFLADDLNDDGLFVTNGEFVTSAAVKVYNVLCAWALYRFAAMAGENRSRGKAIQAVEGALRFQNERGWFAENCLSDPARPLTHTIGYTAQGVLEVGIEAHRDDFVAAAERCVRGAIGAMRPNGFLPGRLDAAWRPAVRWSCLTGQAQLAIVAYRLCQRNAAAELSAAADLLVDFLKAVQRVDTGAPGIDGALAGSYPIMSDYMRAGYPNWATKYLLDALMLQAERSGEPLALVASPVEPPLRT